MNCVNNEEINLTKVQTDMNNTYLLRASIGGAFIGLVTGVVEVLQLCCPFTGLAFIGFAVQLLLMVYYSRQHSQSCGAKGCSYGQVLGFIVVMMAFAGVLYGAIKAVAVNTFAEEPFRAVLGQSIDLLKQMGIYSKSQIKQMEAMMEQMQFNPIFILFTSVMSMVFSSVFYGLVIAAFTRRDADPFAEEPKSDEQIDNQ